MASSARPVKQKLPIGDSFITVKQEHQTGVSVITVKQKNHTGNSVITVKQEHETGNSIVTVKQQHPTEVSFINVKVKTLTGYVKDFWVKRDEPLEQLRMWWRDEGEIFEDYDRFYFVCNGRRIMDYNQTADDIGLKDGDTIVVHLALTGD